MKELLLHYRQLGGSFGIASYYYYHHWFKYGNIGGILKMDESTPGSPTTHRPPPQRLRLKDIYLQRGMEEKPNSKLIIQLRTKAPKELI
jgi:hypothetical protein